MSYMQSIIGGGKALRCLYNVNRLWVLAFIPGTDIDQCTLIWLTALLLSLLPALELLYIWVLVYIVFSCLCTIPAWNLAVSVEFSFWVGVGSCADTLVIMTTLAQWVQALGYSRLKGTYLVISGACTCTCPKDAQALLMYLNPEQHHVLPPFKSWASLCICWCSSVWSCSSDSKGRTKASNQKKIKFSLLRLPV